MNELAHLKNEINAIPIKFGYQFEISFLNNPYESWPQEYKDLFASKISDYVYDLYQFDVDPSIFNKYYKNILSYLKKNLNLSSTEYSMLIDAIDTFKSSITDTLEGKKYEYFIDSINEVNNKMTFLKIIFDTFASFTAYNSTVYLLTYDNKIYKTPEEIAAYILNDKYGYEAIKLTINESYLNMAEIIKENYYIIEKLQTAMKKVGIDGYASPIRGGTDGARLTFMGLPCPNIGTGGENYHGPFEFVSLTMMKQAVEIIKELVKE